MLTVELLFFRQGDGESVKVSNYVFRDFPTIIYSVFSPLYFAGFILEHGSMGFPLVEKNATFINLRQIILRQIDHDFAHD